MSDSQQQPAKQKSQLFKAGQSGNPGGRPKGARNKLQGDFMNRLAEDFSRFGIYAIARARHMDPLGYVKVCASLMPKELEIKAPLDDLSDEQLAAAALTIRTILNAQGNRSDVEHEGSAEQIKNVPALPETV